MRLRPVLRWGLTSGRRRNRGGEESGSSTTVQDLIDLLMARAARDLGVAVSEPQMQGWMTAPPPEQAQPAARAVSAFF